MSKNAASLWGKEPHRLLELEEAWTIVREEVAPLPTQHVSIDRAAGHVSAADVLAGNDYPSFDKAMMDGFAVRAADCTAPRAQLKILALAAAGETRNDLCVGKGEAVRINTGAPLPRGADAVVKIEATQVDEHAAIVTINKPVQAGRDMMRRGEIRQRGQGVLRRGDYLSATAIAAAITSGAGEIDVYTPPSAGIVSTGDEIMPIGTTLKPGQIYDSNGPMLVALLRQFGASSATASIARDNMADLRERLIDAMRHPLVVTIGGMSMGTHDLAPQALADLGVAWRFHGVNLRPGKPIAYGRGPEGQHVFGLPGNPLGAFVCAWLFVRMAVAGLRGLPAEPPTFETATLTADFRAHRDSRPAFVPAILRYDAERGLAATACAWAGSSDPFGAAQANGLLVHRNPGTPLAAGDAVRVIRTDG